MATPGELLGKAIGLDGHTPGSYADFIGVSEDELTIVLAGAAPSATQAHTLCRGLVTPWRIRVLYAFADAAGPSYQDHPLAFVARRARYCRGDEQHRWADSAGMELDAYRHWEQGSPADLPASLAAGEAAHLWIAIAPDWRPALLVAAGEYTNPATGNAWGAPLIRAEQLRSGLTATKIAQLAHQPEQSFQGLCSDGPPRSPVGSSIKDFRPNPIHVWRAARVLGNPPRLFIIAFGLPADDQGFFSDVQSLVTGSALLARQMAALGIDATKVLARLQHLGGSISERTLAYWLTEQTRPRDMVMDALGAALEIDAARLRAAWGGAQRKGGAARPVRDSAPATLGGRRLSERRMARRLTQQALADQVGTSGGLISQIETGATIPSPLLVYALSEVLHVDPAVFLEEFHHPHADSDVAALRQISAGGRAIREFRTRAAIRFEQPTPRFSATKLRRIEAGLVEPTLGELAAISQLLGVPEPEVVSWYSCDTTPAGTMPATNSHATETVPSPGHAPKRT